MNDAYRIDYRASPQKTFEVLIHATDVPADYTFRVQQYVRASLFDTGTWGSRPAETRSVKEAAKPARSSFFTEKLLSRGRVTFVVFFGLLLAAYSVIAGRKNKDMRKAPGAGGQRVLEQY